MNVRLASPPLETSPLAHWLAIGGVLLFPTAATYVYFIVLSGSESMSMVYAGAKVAQFAFPLVWVWAQGFGLLVRRPMLAAGQRSLVRESVRAVAWM